MYIHTYVRARAHTHTHTHTHTFRLNNFSQHHAAHTNSDNVRHNSPIIRDTLLLKER